MPPSESTLFGLEIAGSSWHHVQAEKTTTLAARTLYTHSAGSLSQHENLVDSSEDVTVDF